MPSKYYDAFKKKPDGTETKPEPAQTDKPEETNMPTSAPPPLDMPQIGQQDKLAAALEKIADVIDHKVANLPVLERDFSTITEALSNEEEWKACDGALERDHVKVDDNGKDADLGHYYTVIHNYPMFQSSNAGENIAYVVVEKWRFSDDGTGGKRKQKEGSFNMKFRDFAKRFKTTLAG